MTSYNAPQREDSLSLSLYNPSNFRFSNSELSNYANLYITNNFNADNYFRRAVIFLDVVDFSAAILIFPQMTSFDNLFVGGQLTVENGVFLSNSSIISQLSLESTLMNQMSSTLFIGDISMRNSSIIQEINLLLDNNQFNTIELNSGANILLFDSSRIVQTNSSAENILYKLTLDNDLVVTGLSDLNEVFCSNVSCDNISCNSITQNSENINNILRHTTISDLVITGSIIIPDGTVFDGSVHTDDLIMNDCIIIQDSLTKTNVFAGSTFFSVVSFSGDILQTTPGSSILLQNVTCQTIIVNDTLNVSGVSTFADINCATITSSGDILLNSGIILQQSSANLSNSLGSTSITDLVVSNSALLPFQTFYDQVFNTTNTFYQQNNFNNVNISNFLEISNTDYINSTSFSVLGRASLNRCSVTELTATNLIVNGSITNTQLTNLDSRVTVCETRLNNVDLQIITLNNQVAGLQNTTSNHNEIYTNINNSMVFDNINYEITFIYDSFLGVDFINGYETSRLACIQNVPVDVDLNHEIQEINSSIANIESLIGYDILNPDQLYLTSPIFFNSTLNNITPQLFENINFLDGLTENLTVTLDLLQRNTQQLSYNTNFLFIYGNIIVENNINGVNNSQFDFLLDINENIQVAIDALKQKTQFITSSTINQTTTISNTLNVNTLNATTINSTVSITAPTLNTTTLNSTTLNTTTINTDDIITLNNLTTDTLNCNTITTNLINVTEISGVNINTGSITTTSVNSNTATTTVLNSTTINNSDKITSNLISCNSIDTTNLSVQNLSSVYTPSIPYIACIIYDGAQYNLRQEIVVCSRRNLIINGADDYIIVYPGYFLMCYSGENYTGALLCSLNNTNGNTIYGIKSVNAYNSDNDIRSIKVFFGPNLSEITLPFISYL
jgi:hypothetical protein